MRQPFFALVWFVVCCAMAGGCLAETASDEGRETSDEGRESSGVSESLGEDDQLRECPPDICCVNYCCVTWACSLGGCSCSFIACCPSES
jgi:hypothetical protein